MRTATLKTFDHRLRIGTLMTVWRVKYVWQSAARGCPPSHYYGATPDDPACAEVFDCDLVHLGPWHVSAAHDYPDNEQSFRASRDGDFAWGANLWDIIEEKYCERVTDSDKLQREIEAFEEANQGIE